MLVKILSHAASAIAGSTRHKAMLVSCATVMLAFGSVMGIMMVHGGAPVTTGTAAHNEDSTGQEREDTIWLSGRQVDSRDTRTAEPEAEPQQPPAPDDSGANSDSAPRDTTAEQRPELVVSTTEISLAAGRTSNTLAASLNNVPNLSPWTITINSNEVQQLTITAIEETDSDGVTFRIRAAQDSAPGTYELRVHAVHDNDETRELSRTITVTIPAS